MNLAPVVFAGFAALALAGAGIMAYARSLVRMGFALFLALLGVAGCFAALGADFLAAAEIVVYVGGILILLIFGVMLTSRNLLNRPVLVAVNRLPALLAAGGLLAAILLAFSGAQFPALAQAPSQPTTAPLGVWLLTDGLPAFEFASVLLLAALAGAAYLSRRGQANK